jgi:hypothetical protein
MDPGPSGTGMVISDPDPNHQEQDPDLCQSEPIDTEPRYDYTGSGSRHPDPYPQHWGAKVDEMLDTGNIQKLDKVKGDKANQERHELTRISGIGERP